MDEDRMSYLKHFIELPYAEHMLDYWFYKAMGMNRKVD